MKELKASTKAGQNIVNRASHIDGYFLHDIYSKWSIEKDRAFEWCREQFRETENASLFSICSHNTFGFTCSWVGTKDGERILRYETKDNSYIVWLNR